MGPHYDNKKGIYIKDNQIMEAHWLVHDETGGLYLIPRESDNFEIYGADEDLEALLIPLNDHQLGDEVLLELKGFTIIHPWQRRFNETDGYSFS